MENNKLRLWAMHHPLKAAYCWSFIVLIFVVNLNISGLLLNFIFILMTIIWISSDIQSQLATKKRAINIPNNTYRNQIDFRIPLYLNATLFAYLAIGSFVEGNLLIGICLSLIAICSFIPFNYQDSEYNHMLKQSNKLHEQDEKLNNTPPTNQVSTTPILNTDVEVSVPTNVEKHVLHHNEIDLIKEHAKLVNNNITLKSKKKTKTTSNTLYIDVAGTNYYRLKNAVGYARSNDLFFVRYDDMTASEIREDFYTDDDPVYETDLTDVINEIKLIPDLYNKYDSNAVKVIIYIESQSFMIGYIPKENSKDIKRLIEKERADLVKLTVKGYMTGGKYKAVNLDDHIYTGEKPYSFSLQISVEKTPFAQTSKGKNKEHIIDQRNELIIHKLRKPLNSFVSVDIETTGLNASFDKVIQISAVKYVDDKLIDTFNSFVNPGKEKLPLTEFIINKTGITTQNVKAAPTFNDIKGSFEKFVGDLPWIGHNIFAFDIPFLYESGLSINEFYAEDTFIIARKHLDRTVLGNLKLPTLKEYYGINEPSHNALADSKTAALVYKHLRDDKLPKILKDANDKMLSLNGIHFLVIGSFPEFDHDQMIEQIKLRGGIIENRWTNNTQYLINGITNKHYKSIQNAKDHNVQFLNFNSLVALINTKDQQLQVFDN